MPFSNPVMGGKDIVRQSMQSPNFDLGAQTGWKIDKNGDAWFFNITATGAITGNTVVVSGTGDGVFVYSGTPGPGTLVVAIVSAAGADPYGNPYSGPGIDVFVPGQPGNQIEVRPDKGAVLFYGT